MPIFTQRHRMLEAYILSPKSCEPENLKLQNILRSSDPRSRVMLVCQKFRVWTR